MRALGLLPAAGLIGGTLGVLALPADWATLLAARSAPAPGAGPLVWWIGCALLTALLAALLTALLVGVVAWWRDRRPLALVAVGTGFALAGAALALDATDRAVHTPLRAALDRHIGGFDLGSWDAPPRHDPVLVRAVIRTDAGVAAEPDASAAAAASVTVQADATSVKLGGQWVPVSGGLMISMGGDVPAARLREWVAGRTIEAPMTLRRAARYVNQGVGDFERDLALRGVTLLASVKSSLLVDVRARGGLVEEAAAGVRQRTRLALERWVAPRNRVASALVAAVLIGDRAGISDAVRERLQAAGTYHVIAISGGNIAIFVALVAVVPLLAGVSARGGAWFALVVLAAYSQVVAAGPSVWRASLMAALHLLAIGLDHRAPSVHAAALAVAVMIAVQPLDVWDPGFVLTFGATAALLLAAGRVQATGGSWLVRWGAAAVLATIVVDLVLLPVTALAFGQVTAAGIVLNLLALPLMAAVQVSGLLVVLLDVVQMPAGWPGWAASSAAVTLVESARLVELAPWSWRQVGPPSILLLTLYYGAGSVVVWGAGRARTAASVVLGLAVVAVWADVPVTVAVTLPVTVPVTVPAWPPWIAGAPPTTPGAPLRVALRVTMFDVGQGESILVQPPGGGAMLVDTGGRPFGGDRFDIGRLVLAPALRALGVGALDAVVVTHADPDHVGGARSVLDRFDVRRLWLGIPVPGHGPSRELLAHAHDGGTSVGAWRAGQGFDYAGVRVRVLHPPAPDWERRRVRNDDSVVVELTHGDIAMLLTGDVSAEVERAVLPQLSASRVRVLKVAHHGSRTSTSSALVEGWRPQVALISCGRGNPFGHPAPDVVERLERAGARIYRTDRDGAITVESDGRELRVRTARSG